MAICRIPGQVHIDRSAAARLPGSRRQHEGPSPAAAGRQGLLFNCRLISRYLTLRMSEAGIPALRKLPCGVARRYPGFA